MPHQFDDDEINTRGSVGTFPQSFAHEMYSQALSGAVRVAHTIRDPSWALAQDPDAWKKMLRDTEIARCVKQRRHMVAGRDFVIEPATASPEDKKAAAIVSQAMKSIRRFSMARFNLTDAIFRGSAYARIIGERKPISWAIGKQEAALENTPVMDWWVPTKIVDVDRLRFLKMRDAEGEIKWHFFSVQRTKWEPIEADQLAQFIRHIHEDDESTLDYGRGLMESIYWYWYAKTIALEHGLMGLERWAMGVVKAKISGLRDNSDDLTNTTVVNNTIAALEKMRSRFVIAHDAEDDISVLDGPSTGHQIVTDFISYCDNAICKICLGSVLPFGGGTDKGSLARAETEKDVSDDFIAFDRQLLAEDITDSLIKLFWNSNQLNFAEIGLAGANMPRLEIRSEQSKNPLERAQVLSALAGSGVRLPIRKDELYDVLDFAMPNSDDDVVEVGGQPAGGLDSLTSLFNGGSRFAASGNGNGNGSH